MFRSGFVGVAILVSIVGSGAPDSAAEMKENALAAAQMWTSLANLLTTASLAFMAFEGPLLWFLLRDVRRDDWRVTPIWILVSLSLLLLISSIVAAGVGVDSIAQRGASGDWTLQPNHFLPFKCQTWFTFFAIGLFGIATLLSAFAKVESDQRLLRLESAVDELRARCR